MADGEEGFESLLTWFEHLSDVAIKLKTNNYVLLSNIESNNLWLEFIKNGDNIAVSNFISSQKEGSAIRLHPIKPDKEGSILDPALSYTIFCKEIKKRTLKFLNLISFENPDLLIRKDLKKLKEKTELY